MLSRDRSGLSSCAVVVDGDAAASNTEDDHHSSGGSGDGGKGKATNRITIISLPFNSTSISRKILLLFLFSSSSSFSSVPLDRFAPPAHTCTHEIQCKKTFC